MTITGMNAPKEDFFEVHTNTSVHATIFGSFWMTNIETTIRIEFMAKRLLADDKMK